MTEQQLRREIAAAQYFRRLAIRNRSPEIALRLTHTIARLIENYHEQFVYVPKSNAQPAGKGSGAK